MVWAVLRRHAAGGYSVASGWIVRATVLLIAGFACATAMAHEIRPAVVTLTLDADGSYTLRVSANVEALVAGIGAEHKDTSDAPGAAAYNRLRALPAAELRRHFDEMSARWLDGLRVEFDGARAMPQIEGIEIPTVGDTALARLSTIALTGRVPAGTRTVRWSYSATFGSSVLRIVRPGGGDPETAWLKDGTASEPIPLAAPAARGRLAVAADYVVLGFTHIVPKGIDHILFVLGLYLLSVRTRPLLVQVTAFTIAHSITLALGLYGVVEVPAAIVEPLIAASIVYVAIENVWTGNLTPWRPFVVFAFGLLHGLGFAGILLELGLPREDYVLGLVGFNVGVELGQLAVIAVAWLATGLWFRNRSWYRARIVVPASLLIAAVGFFWMIERVIAAGIPGIALGG